MQSEATNEEKIRIRKKEKNKEKRGDNQKDGTRAAKEEGTEAGRGLANI